MTQPQCCIEHTLASRSTQMYLSVCSGCPVTEQFPRVVRPQATIAPADRTITQRDRLGLCSEFRPGPARSGSFLEHCRQFTCDRVSQRPRKWPAAHGPHHHRPNQVTCAVCVTFDYSNGAKELRIFGWLLCARMKGTCRDRRELFRRRVMRGASFRFAPGREWSSIRATGSSRSRI